MTTDKYYFAAKFEGTEAQLPILEVTAQKAMKIKRNNLTPTEEHLRRGILNDRTMQVVPNDLITLELLDKPNAVRFFNLKHRDAMIAELKAKQAASLADIGKTDTKKEGAAK